MQDKRGFTLIEMMVVVVILGILAATVVPKFLSRPQEARIIAAKQDIHMLLQSLQLYYLDNGMYPSTDQGLSALYKAPDIPPIPLHWKSGGYIDHLPKDPWGFPYQYLNPGMHGTIDVYSYGASGDQAKTSAGFIGSWSLE